jgi:hypothetical protein
MRSSYTLAGLIIIGVGFAILFLTQGGRKDPYILNRLLGAVAGGAAVLLGLLLLLYSFLGAHEVVL